MENKEEFDVEVSESTRDPIEDFSEEDQELIENMESEETLLSEEPLPTTDSDEDFDDDISSDIDELETTGFMGDVDFDLDDVTVVPTDKLRRTPTKRDYVAQAINVTLANNHTIRKQLDSMGFNDTRIEDEIKNGNEEWILSVVRAVEISLDPDNIAMRAATRPGSVWDTMVEHQGENIAAKRTKSSFSASGLSEPTANEAVMIYDSLSSSGSTFEIPLWHSGIWLYIKRPTLSDSIELDKQIANERSVLGRNTRGASFANDGLFISKHVVEFALKHTFDHNVKGGTKDILRSLILQPDIQTIAWALGLVEYPAGFPFDQACTANPSKCKHVTKEIVNLSKVHRPDTSRFDSEHRKFMAGHSTKRTIEDITKYQETLDIRNPVVKVNDYASIVMRIPTIENHLEAGYAWVNEIEANTVATFGITLEGNARATYEEDQAIATRLRNYAHWVDKIVLKSGDVTTPVTDRTAIDKLLVKMSSDRREVNIIQNAIDEFMSANLLVVIGTPNYQCPSCNSYMMSRKGPESVIIPWDPVSIFFNLQQFKIERNMSE